MTGLLRRSVALLVAAAIVAALVPTMALGSGRDVLADFEDNGFIDGCYTRAEFQEALALARDDERQYGAAVEVIQGAELTNVAVPGEPCPPEDAASDIADPDDGGTGAGLWIGLAIAVGLVAVGAGVWARRSSGRAGP